MKKGFTLVELLIVVVVLVTLMSMVFRLGNIGSESEKRAITIDRMQRLENAISGYFAAFGMYPPVPVHGSRNIFLRVKNGVQSDDPSDSNENLWGWVSSDGLSVNNKQQESAAWNQIRPACASQPVGCEFPFDKSYQDIVTAASEELKSNVESSSYATADQKQRFSIGFDDGTSQNIGRFNEYLDDPDWSHLQLFKFGVMSFLLPRYLVMMNGDPNNSELKQLYGKCAQWTTYNREQSDSWTGQKMSWDKVYQNVNGDSNGEMMRVANIPSQAICARWMANFERSLSCNGDKKIFGVNIRSYDGYTTLPSWNEDSDREVGYVSATIYSPGGYEGGAANQYILDSITMRDGWYNDLYYYSPAPYQTYVVWSAGPNGRTFPPWITRDKLSSDAQRCISYWTKDDIVGQSN